MWVTPLAGPVLPEVKKITAGAPGSGGSVASDSGSASRSVREVVAPIGVARRGILAPGRERLRVAVGDRPKLEVARSLARGDVLGPLDMSDEGAGAAHLQRVVDLAGGVAVVQRRGDQPLRESRPGSGRRGRSCSASARRGDRPALARVCGSRRQAPRWRGRVRARSAHAVTETIATSSGAESRPILSSSLSGAAGASSSAPSSSIRRDSRKSSELSTPLSRFESPRARRSHRGARRGIRDRRDNLRSRHEPHAYALEFVTTLAVET